MPPPSQKKFVKYTFDQSNNNKPREPSQSKKVYRQRDTNIQGGRTRRNVSYTQKTSSKNNVLRDMINSFVGVKKPSKNIEQLMSRFPKYFNSTPKQPQPFSQQSLNGYLIILGKKPMDREARTFGHIQQQQESDPNWDSQSDQEGGIQSKKMDEQFVEKIQQKLGIVKQLRKDELKRHQKQFLQDYYRQKHQQQLQNEENAQGNKQQQTKNDDDLLEQTANNKDNLWTQYQQQQVKQFINMGFIQKIQVNEDEADDMDFGDDDFSVEDQKQQKPAKEQSSSEQDDVFGDVGPTTIIKKKQITEQDEAQRKNAGSISHGTVLINSHVFSRIAELAGIPPGACIWIIRNKTQRYKVTTQFMDQMYRLNKFCDTLPYVSLNHSQFVHNNDVEKQKGIQIFKKFNARKHQYNNHQHKSNNNGNRSYENKRKLQYKPGTAQNSKSHLNKK